MMRVDVVKAFRFVIPIMIIIGWASWFILNRDHTEVPEQTRIYITIGAVVLSGVISFFLFPKNEGEKY